MRTWLEDYSMSHSVRAGLPNALTDKERHHTPGEASEELSSDEVEVRFVTLTGREDRAGRYREQRRCHILRRDANRLAMSVETGRLVTVRYEDVPTGINAEDHEAGLMSTLNILPHSSRGSRK